MFLGFFSYVLTFSTEEILDWIASQVHEEDRFSICVFRELIFSAEACNNGSGRRRHHPNVDLRSHSLARQASILGPLVENFSQVEMFVYISQ